MKKKLDKTKRLREQLKAAERSIEDLEKIAQRYRQMLLDNNLAHLFTIHVAAHGDDDRGCISNYADAYPFRTVGKALACALPGDKIFVHPGKYGDQVKIKKQVKVK